MTGALGLSWVDGLDLCASKKRTMVLGLDT